MRRFVAIVAVALRRALGGKRPFLALLAALPLLRPLTAGNADAFDVFHETLAVILLLVHPIISLVLGAATLGDERRDETLSIVVTKPIRRGVIVAAKATASVIGILVLVAPTAAVLIAYAGTSADRWDVTLPFIVLLTLNSMAYVGLFAPLGYLFSRAVIAGLLYIVIWEASISFIEGLAPASIWRIGLSAYVSLLTDAPHDVVEALGSVTAGAGGAVLKAIGVTVVGGWLLAALLKRRDIVGATEA